MPLPLPPSIFKTGSLNRSRESERESERRYKLRGKRGKAPPPPPPLPPPVPSARRRRRCRRSYRRRRRRRRNRFPFSIFLLRAKADRSNEPPPIALQLQTPTNELPHCQRGGAAGSRRPRAGRLAGRPPYVVVRWFVLIFASGVWTSLSLASPFLSNSKSPSPPSIHPSAAPTFLSRRSVAVGHSDSRALLHTLGVRVCLSAIFM